MRPWEWGEKYVCKICGNELVVIKGKGELKCCDKKMERFVLVKEYERKWYERKWAVIYAFWLQIIVGTLVLWGIGGQLFINQIAGFLWTTLAWLIGILFGCYIAFNGQINILKQR